MERVAEQATAKRLGLRVLVLVLAVPALGRRAVLDVLGLPRGVVQTGNARAGRRRRARDDGGQQKPAGRVSAGHNLCSHISFSFTRCVGKSCRRRQQPSVDDVEGGAWDADDALVVLRALGPEVVGVARGAVGVHGVVHAVAFVGGHAGHGHELLPGEAEHGVAALVVELVLALGGLVGPRDVVVLGHAHAAAEEVAGGGAGVHGELARVDDAEAAVRGEVGAVGEAGLAVGSVGEVIGLLRQHGELRGERAVAEEEAGRAGAPGLEIVLRVLDEDVERVGHLLHDAEEVDVLAADLGGGFVLVVVLLVHEALVAGGLEERNVHVEVVGELDGADELRELVLEVLAPRGGHHEVVLHGDGETLADSVAGERALGLREHAGGGLVRHARRDALVETVHVPLELLVGVLEVHVRQYVAGERRVGSVCNQAVDAVCKVLVVALEGVGEVPALVALVALGVDLDVAAGRAEDIFIHFDGGLRAGAGEGAAAHAAGVAILEVHGMRKFAVRVRLSDVKTGRHFARYVSYLNMCAFTKTPSH